MYMYQPPSGWEQIDEFMITGENQGSASFTSSSDSCGMLKHMQNLGGNNYAPPLGWGQIEISNGTEEHTILVGPSGQVFDKTQCNKVGGSTILLVIAGAAALWFLAKRS
jgi:hypothetical protein